MISMSKMKKIPKFKSEKEEAVFWSTHDSTEYESEETKVKFARPKKKLVSLRLDDKTIHQLKKIAESKGIGYLQLVRMWVLENLSKTKAA
jgi:predicted DNA binding CopG/RHH family protein